ncbi:class I SAM-dependent methyltransferase [Verminephrobacter aporrectodeae]|uniref:Class I SAM-dependent methyltransferase n=1 Tax=Verminephrobacter aporrectodeae subsp. tuberculatae TaxID=1110392 RepID=A0ABT3KXY7_9BURK|nr:class I SAM-dependent methyltransferase [Verminephrobacter aporrectodeae]MCW5256441.1 class I SAM-dependent methyltransferase [Verminephrobacter aporrectodeae subsp. tuberculatae]MCW5323196.1 class I SAM-dependent methyltransferase [Verminephrobacter aporrectodeae subsp. tuberculatae]MCW8177261.1 class I SAM-dependent methyltransferase [Verminephrobacter aporrectodeae subsp. tuberculatae]MCW8200335.1 class I SAM-dependent methyltransferase [Verminephrobacter aporrectodeae subsp. tuberculatae
MDKRYNLDYEAMVIKYFDAKATEYDLVEEQVYWRLSDRLLWTVLIEQVLDCLPANFRFIDAGGGTGRWTIKILQAYPHAQALIYDLSMSMTEQALESAQKLGVSDRQKICNGRLENIDEALDPGFDLIFNFHNVLGFVQSPHLVVTQLKTLLRDDGVLVSFVPNSYHATFFNIMRGRLDEARRALMQNRSRFTEDMPDMHFFTPTAIAKMYRDTGLIVEHLTGFPNLIYPGYQETQLRGSSSGIQNVLGTQEAFDDIYEMEYQAQKDGAIVARSNNIFIVGRKLAQSVKS